MSPLPLHSSAENTGDMVEGIDAPWPELGQFVLFSVNPPTSVTGLHVAQETFRPQQNFRDISWI